MSKTLLTLVVAVAVAGAGSVAYARGGGGGGGGMGGSMGGSHMSSQGMANTNGPEAVDRDKGLDRAEDRWSAKAGSHEKATDKTKTRRKGKTTESTDEQR